MWTSGFDNGQDAVHVIETATGLHNNSWYYTSCSGCSVSDFWYGGTAAMYENQIFIVFPGG